MISSRADTHIHASQHPNAGLFGKTTLLSWLTTYTYPLEASLKTPSKARTVYDQCVSRTLSHGTTTAAYYATAHVSSTNILADICLAKGQRAFIGRVCMDTDLSPEYYRDESPEFAIKETEAVIAHCHDIDPKRHLITPILTPRFAPSCTPPLLSSLGHLAAETQLPIQTHIAENTAEVALVRERFPDHANYAAVYDDYGLLTPKMVLAHAIHLSPDETALIKKRQSCISHCPVSNISLSSGLCPVRELLDNGITVGLGTDVSGGYSSSMLVAAREASMVSRTLASLISDDENEEIETPAAHEQNERQKTTIRDRKKLSVEECLYLATVGGARCLGLEHKISRFEVGMEWDAQLIELTQMNVEHDGSGDGEGEMDAGLPELWGKEKWDEKVAKWLFCGDDRNTKRVYVRGKLVHQRG